MTTKRILEIEDAGVGYPDCYFGQGAVFASKESRIKRAKRIVRLVEDDLMTRSTFEQAEALAKLRGRVI